MTTKIFSDSDEAVNEKRIMRAVYMGIAMHAFIGTMVRSGDGALRFDAKGLAAECRVVADAMVEELQK